MTHGWQTPRYGPLVPTHRYGPVVFDPCFRLCNFWCVGQYENSSTCFAWGASVILLLEENVFHACLARIRRSTRLRSIRRSHRTPTYSCTPLFPISAPFSPLPSIFPLFFCYFCFRFSRKNECTLNARENLLSTRCNDCKMCATPLESSDNKSTSQSKR